MNRLELNDWLQIVGMLAIVLSLLFVGMQLKQSQEIAIASQYQERANTAIESWRHRQLNPLYTRRIGQRELDNHGILPGMNESASVEELGDQIIEIQIVFFTFDNMHFQYEAGFLTQEAWEWQLRGLQSFLLMPQFRHFVDMHNERLRESYAELLRDMSGDKSEL